MLTMHVQYQSLEVITGLQAAVVFLLFACRNVFSSSSLWRNIKERHAKTTDCAATAKHSLLAALKLRVETRREVTLKYFLRFGKLHFNHSSSWRF